MCIYRTLQQIHSRIVSKNLGLNDCNLYCVVFMRKRPVRMTCLILMASVQIYHKAECLLTTCLFHARFALSHLSYMINALYLYILCYDLSLEILHRHVACICRLCRATYPHPTTLQNINNKIVTTDRRMTSVTHGLNPYGLCISCIIHYVH